jgi:sugar phosphate isomerase/epimerase
MFEEKSAVSRRRLLAMGAAVVGASTLPGLPAAAAQQAAATGGTYTLPVDDGALLPRERIGIQLYTIRNAVGSEGFAQVFKRLAAIGYTEVEFAGYLQRDSRVKSLAELRMLLEDNGLRAAGSHMQSGDINREIDEALQLGIPAIGVPSINVNGKTRSGWKQQAATWNEWGRKARDAGLVFYLHNHSAEFGTFADDNGAQTRHYDAILQETDPSVVFMEMDIHWAYVGQAQSNYAFNPVDYVLNNPARFALFHVKDGVGNIPRQIPAAVRPKPTGYTMVDVGQGDIDFQGFFNAIRGVDPDMAKRGYMLEHDSPGQPHGDWRTACTGYGWMAHGLRVG